MAKAKQAKHTSAELKKKARDATINRGGGSAGLEDRKGGKAGHAKYACPVCKQQAPDLKTLQIHHEAKHPKLPWDQAAAENLHEKFGATTVGVAVVGSKKK
ncbi:unnamed protein product [Pedinophyceae sp. YPF-701]|nr:unnamed protein product [Pedinophyceae sp. YPF-701]